MPIFVCTTCRTIENTALVDSFWSQLQAFRRSEVQELAVICSACETGEWHGRFPRVTYTLEIHGPIKSDGTIRSTTTEAPAPMPALPTKLGHSLSCPDQRCGKRWFEFAAAAGMGVFATKYRCEGSCRAWYLIVYRVVLLERGVISAKVIGTPRLKGRDAGSLREALETPSLGISVPEVEMLIAIAELLTREAA